MIDLQVFMESFTAISFGLMAGIYFIFSNTVMKSLASVSDAHAAIVMVKINNAILNPAFFLLFWGSGITACLTIMNFLARDIPLIKIIGATVFLIGSNLVTLVINVPLNKKLASNVYTNNSMDEFWNSYLKNWTRWNHVRTFCASLGFMLVVI